MSENKIELKITKDIDSKDIKLSEMSLAAAKSFLIILQSLTDIIELTPNADNIKISIIEGSAVAQAEGTATQIEAIETNFNAVLNNQSTNKDLVDKWRNLQNLFSANGLEYEANIYKNSAVTQIYQTIKTARQFRTKPTRKKPDTNIEFLSGKLIEVGGKKPNIHLLKNEIKIPISCSELNAKRANRYLYENINISIWENLRENAKTKYEFCDVYGKPETFNSFKEFIAEYMNENDEIVSLKKLHYQCKSLLDKGDFINMGKFMRLFNHKSSDPNALKTILVITNDFKDHEDIYLDRNPLKKLLDEKIKNHTKHSYPF